MTADIHNDKQTLARWLKQESNKFNAGIIKVVALSLGSVTARLFALYFIALIVNSWVIDQQAASTSILLKLVISLAISLAISNQRDSQRTSLAQQVSHYFQQSLQDKLSQRSLALVRQYEIASWQSFFTRRVLALQNYYSDYLPQMYLALIVPVVIICTTFYISWLAAIILLATAPLIPLFMWLVGKGAAIAHRENFIAIERLSGIFLDRLRAQNLLRAFNQIETERNVFAKSSSHLKDKTLKVVSIAFLSSSVLDFFSTVSMALVAVVVGFTLLGEINFGHWQSGLNLQEGLFLLLIAPVFYSELKTLGRLYHDRAEAIGAAEEFHSILQLPPLNYDTTLLPIAFPKSSILSSDKQKKILSFPILNLSSGDKILLSGPSGSGKTSLLEALLGFRPLASSDTFKCLKPESVAWLNQRPPVLPSSVRDNLQLLSRNKDANLLAVLELVGLSSWIEEQPDGLDTLMGDYPPLSGGQRQRFAIARLLLQKPKVVFLDEPTAHLAAEQHWAINKLLKEYFIDNTVIWVSHGLIPDGFFTQCWSVNNDGILHVNRPVA